MVSAFAWLLLSVTTNAQAVDLVLQNYPEARVMFQSKEKTSDYLLAMSTYRKIDGQWRAERQRRVSGELTRLTLELPQNHSAQAGFDFYREQLQKFNRRELFSCRARACGASNTWANNHFKIIQLYGLDEFQFYSVYEVITESNIPYYVSLYAVQRGNKRVYVQLDILRSDKQRIEAIATTPDTIAELLLSEGFYVFPDPVTDNASGLPQLKITPMHLQTLVTVLQQHSDWRVGLVGHDYHAENVADQQRYSLTYAEQLKAALVAAGIPTARLVVYGLGSLAPAGRGDSGARVEIVLMP
jgi:hypothetical protein